MLQGWALNELAISYALSGQPRHAMPLFAINIVILSIKGV